MKISNSNSRLSVNKSVVSKFGNESNSVRTVIMTMNNENRTVIMTMNNENRTVIMTM